MNVSSAISEKALVQSLILDSSQQAQAVGASLSATQFAAIYSSPLKRTYMTAQAIQSQQQTGSPSVVTSPLFREQHFGVAEGKPSTRKKDPDISLAEQFERGIYPGSLSRSERFPEGESLDEVQERASKGWAEILLPYVQEKARQDNNQVHVAVISHGLFIKEAIRALAKYDRTADLSACDYQWLRNTAWARVVVEMKVQHRPNRLVAASNKIFLDRHFQRKRSRFFHQAICCLSEFN